MQINYASEAIFASGRLIGTSLDMVKKALNFKLG